MKSLLNILTIGRREFRLILDDKWTSAAMLVVPLIVALVMTLIYSNRVAVEIPTVIVDEDQSQTSRLLARALDASEFIEVVQTQSNSEGIEAIMRDGEIRFAAEIPKDFEQELKRGARANILTYVNGSNIVEAISVIKGATTVAGTLSAGVSMEKLQKRGVPSTHALNTYMPVEVTQRFLFNPAESYSHFLLPGILIALLQQVIVVGAALTWAREFQEGISSSLTSLSNNIWEQLTGKLLSYIVIGMLWSFVFFVGIFGAAEIPFNGSVLAAIAALVLMLAAMGMLAMFISAVAPNKATAMQFVFIAASPAFLVSGYTFPLEAMTLPVQIFANIIPLTHFLTAWRRIVMYGAGFNEVAIQLLIMGIMNVTFALPTVWTVRRKMATQVVAVGGCQ